MPGRSLTLSVGDKHRFGFNGMEGDDEITTEGGSLNFGARIYDSWIGRWLSVDYLQSKFPSVSPYVFGGNNPILPIDSDGNLIINAHEKGSDEHDRVEAGIEALKSRNIELYSFAHTARLMKNGEVIYKNSSGEIVYEGNKEYSKEDLNSLYEKSQDVVVNIKIENIDGEKRRKETGVSDASPSGSSMAFGNISDRARIIHKNGHLEGPDMGLAGVKEVDDKFVVHGGTGIGC
ncbi:MAG: RHS repeat-associated core domain-containing protein [Bacteroidota bacterium]